MKYELKFSYNDGGVAYLLQSVAIHFNLTVGVCSIMQQDSIGVKGCSLIGDSQQS